MCCALDSRTWGCHMPRTGHSDASHPRVRERMQPQVDIRLYIGTRGAARRGSMEGKGRLRPVQRSGGPRWRRDGPMIGVHFASGMLVGRSATRVSGLVGYSLGIMCTSRLWRTRMTGAWMHSPGMPAREDAPWGEAVERTPEEAPCCERRLYSGGSLHWYSGKTQMWRSPADSNSGKGGLFPRGLAYSHIGAR